MKKKNIFLLCCGTFCVGSAIGSVSAYLHEAARLSNKIVELASKEKKMASLLEFKGQRQKKRPSSQYDDFQSFDMNHDQPFEISNPLHFEGSPKHDTSLVQDLAKKEMNRHQDDTFAGVHHSPYATQFIDGHIVGSENTVYTVDQAYIDYLVHAAKQYVQGAHITITPFDILLWSQNGGFNVPQNQLSSITQYINKLLHAQDMTSREEQKDVNVQAKKTADFSLQELLQKYKVSPQQLNVILENAKKQNPESFLTPEEIKNLRPKKIKPAPPIPSQISDVRQKEAQESHQQDSGSSWKNVIERIAMAHNIDPEKLIDFVQNEVEHAVNADAEAAPTFDWRKILKFIKEQVPELKHEAVELARVLKEELNQEVAAWWSNWKDGVYIDILSKGNHAVDHLPESDDEDFQEGVKQADNYEKHANAFQAVLGDIAKGQRRFTKKKKVQKSKQSQEKQEQKNKQAKENDHVDLFEELRKAARQKSSKSSSDESSKGFVSKKLQSNVKALLEETEGESESNELLIKEYLQNPESYTQKYHEELKSDYDVDDSDNEGEDEVNFYQEAMRAAQHLKAQGVTLEQFEQAVEQVKRNEAQKIVDLGDLASFLAGRRGAMSGGYGIFLSKEEQEKYVQQAKAEKAKQSKHKTKKSRLGQDEKVAWQENVDFNPSLEQEKYTYVSKQNTKHSSAARQSLLEEIRKANYKDLKSVGKDLSQTTSTENAANSQGTVAGSEKEATEHESSSEHKASLYDVVLPGQDIIGDDFDESDDDSDWSDVE